MTRRELVSPKNDNQGHLEEFDDVGGSLPQDRRKRATNRMKPRHGDRGDQRRH